MQALVDKEIAEHKSVVLWRAKTGFVNAFDQIRLEMFFGAMVFKPVRAEHQPPGTNRVLNWAAYGLYQEKSYHLLSAAEVADKKKLCSKRQKLYREQAQTARRTRGDTKPAKAARRTRGNTKPARADKK
jgi:hypothetical protein